MVSLLLKIIISKLMIKTIKQCLTKKGTLHHIPEVSAPLCFCLGSLLRDRCPLYGFSIAGFGDLGCFV